MIIRKANIEDQHAVVPVLLSAILSGIPLYKEWLSVAVDNGT